MDEGTFSFIAFFAWVTIGAFVGRLIGQSKGKGEMGMFLGAVLGVIGWIIILILPEDGIKCPECFGSVPIGARKCKHCGSDLREAIKRHDAARAEAYQPRGKKMEQAIYTKCPCCKCGGSIEFNLMHFDRHNPPEINCPHCGERTVLFVDR